MSLERANNPGKTVGCIRETPDHVFFFWKLPGQLVGVQQICERDHDSPHIAVAYSRAYVSAFVCQQRRRSASGREKDTLSPSLSSRRGGVFVPNRMQAEGQQIDYPACSQRVQGLCGQALKKQRPLSADAPKHTRANVIIMG